MVICLKQSANDLHMVQLMPLSPVISYFVEIQNGYAFQMPSYASCLEKGPSNGCCYCVVIVVVVVVSMSLSISIVSKALMLRTCRLAHLSVCPCDCLSGKCIVAKWLNGSGCRLGW